MAKNADKSKKQPTSMEMEILRKLDHIEQDVAFIKECLEDSTVSKDDIESIQQGEKEFKEGKTISLAEVERELRL